MNLPIRVIVLVRGDIKDVKGWRSCVLHVVLQYLPLFLVTSACFHCCDVAAYVFFLQEISAK